MAERITEAMLRAVERTAAPYEDSYHLAREVRRLRGLIAEAERSMEAVRTKITCPGCGAVAMHHDLRPGLGLLLTEALAIREE